jgi:glutamate-1-semialdehyde 2,1-aminomutase
MFGLFFSTETQVDSFTKVMQCDQDRFKTFFHAMLEKGIYLAPSAFEAGFVSAAHSEADLDETLATAATIFKQLSSN